MRASIYSKSAKTISSFSLGKLVKFLNQQGRRPSARSISMARSNLLSVGSYPHSIFFYSLPSFHRTTLRLTAGPSIPSSSHHRRPLLSRLSGRGDPSLPRVAGIFIFFLLFLSFDCTNIGLDTGLDLFAIRDPHRFREKILSPPGSRIRDLVLSFSNVDTQHTATRSSHFSLYTSCGAEGWGFHGGLQRPSATVAVCASRRTTFALTKQRLYLRVPMRGEGEGQMISA